MGFSSKQVQALKRNVNQQYIRTRIGNGRELSYIQGAHAISEANRIFGFDGWDRETVESRCVMSRETRGVFLVVYIAKSRITVRTDGGAIIREGQGSGEAKASSPGEAHDLALKIAETDATKRALATFGKPFGLALYNGSKPKKKTDEAISVRSAQSIEQGVQDAHTGADKRAMVNPGDGSSKSDLDPAETQKLARHIDKSVLTIGAPKRLRDKAHLRFVASQPCTICSYQPSDPHHLRFAQLRSLGRKVSDEFTVPLCRKHHRQLHQSGNEQSWWYDLGVDPLPIASELWNESQSAPNAL